MGEKKKLTPDIKAPDIKEAITQLIKRGYPGFNLRPEDLKGETWKDIPGYKGLYQVSNLGRVKSFATFTNNKEKVKVIIMKQYFEVLPSQKPQFWIQLIKNRIKKRFATDTVVGRTFLGKKKLKEVYAHINKDRLDNRAENLKIVTKSDRIKLNHKFYFIRLSDNKIFLRHDLGKEYKRQHETILHNINAAIRAEKKCYGSFWKKDYLQEFRDKESFSNILRIKRTKDLKNQIASAYTNRYIFTKSKKEGEKKHISVSRHRANREKRRMKLTESGRRKYAGFNMQLEDLNGEEWRDIPGYNGLYCVSNLGRVKSCGRYRANGSWWKEKIRKQSLIIRDKVRNGLSVDLYQNKKDKRFQVSMLVGMAFLRERKKNEVYAHFNKDPLDNRLENIKVMTEKESVKLNFATHVSFPAKYEFIRLADGKQFLYRDLEKEYNREQAVVINANINSGIEKNKKRYGSFWTKRLLK